MSDPKVDIRLSLFFALFVSLLLWALGVLAITYLLV